PEAAAASPRLVSTFGNRRAIGTPAGAPSRTGLGGPGSPFSITQRVATLPFTGLPLWLAMLAGLALIAAGLTMRRRWEPSLTA
ncbi:MAG: hypothetical protein ACRDN6_12820, partial [Gaiellaceae bacterium]